jgi:Fe-S cluster biogenesis protein NfuA
MEIHSTEQKIKDIINKVRPFIKMHGGDVDFAGLKRGELTLEIRGACVGCALSELTYNQILGELIKKEVPAVKKIKLINNK